MSLFLIVLKFIKVVKPAMVAQYVFKGTIKPF